MRRSFVFFFVSVALTTGLLGQQTAPKAVRNTNPIYPYDLLIQGRDGWAEVQFTVEYSGRAILANIVDASDPAFAKALLADIESNEFMPPRVNGLPRLAQGSLRHNFKAAAGLDPLANQILLELRKPMSAMPHADQLDKNPKALRQDLSNYPYSLLSDGISGRAELEVVVDRNGRVLFPRVVSATNEDIGYAAAAAVSRWKYEPPMKDGKPVDARVTITVTYDKTKMASSM